MAMYERKKADIRNTFLTWIHSDTMKTLVWEFTKVWTYLEENKDVIWRDRSQSQIFSDELYRVLQNGGPNFKATRWQHVTVTQKIYKCFNELLSFSNL